jgi:CheY-like chemotaxis protein
VTDSLTSRNISVDCASVAERALELVATNCYDAILCDLNLESESGMSVSGFDLYDRIRENLESRSIVLPLFIFMTGDLVDFASDQQTIRQGSLILQKPFRIAELLLLLGNSLPPAAAVFQPKNSSSKAS